MGGGCPAFCLRCLRSSPCLCASVVRNSGKSLEDRPVRRTLVRSVFPLILCLIPPACAFVVWQAIPERAWNFYLQHISPMDMLILGLGGSMFVLQMLLSWQALGWRETGFDERPDPWLNRFGQAAEWFPLLGLLGTVTAILQTFSEFKNPQ